MLTLAEQSARHRHLGQGRRNQHDARERPTFYRIDGARADIGAGAHGQSCARCATPTTPGASSRASRQALATRLDVYESEYRIIRPSDGQVRWIFGRGRTMRRRRTARRCATAASTSTSPSASRPRSMSRALMHEVNHRANNLLAVVQAMAHNMIGATGSRRLRRASVAAHLGACRLEQPAGLGQVAGRRHRPADPLSALTLRQHRRPGCSVGTAAHPDAGGSAGDRHGAA